MQMSFLLFCAPKIDLNDVTSGNLNGHKDHEDEVFLPNNILHFPNMLKPKWLHVLSPILTTSVNQT